MRLMTLKTISLALVVAAGPVAAQEDLPAGRARIHSVGTAAALTPPSSAGALEVVRGFLRERGVSPLTLGSLRSVSEHHVARTGMTHLWLEQEVAGLTVYDAYTKAAPDDRGERVHLIEDLVPLSTADVRPARIGPDEALGAALLRLYPGLARPGAVGRRGATVLFDPGRVFYRAPRVRPVAVPTGRGGLSAAFPVETWSGAGNEQSPIG